MRALVWFRADLRVEDNTALSAATHTADKGVVGVFTICPQQWRRHDWADAKVDFILRSLVELSAALRRLNIPLLVRTTPDFDGIPAMLADLAAAHACDALYFNHEYEVNEARRDAAVTVALERAGRTVHAFHDQTIVPPAAVRTGQGTFYTVFTPYKRAWLAHVESSGEATLRSPARRQPALVCEPDDVPGSIEGFDRARALPRLWPAGEAQARKRLAAFIETRIGEYNRSRDFPAESGTSQLSPYLAVGAISPRVCLYAARAANKGNLADGLAGPSTWISELVWREFYRHVLVGFPRVCMHRPFRLDTDSIAWRDNDDEFAAWCEGRTGFPIVDAAMRQLAATGWIHNRLRMIAAMFLTKHLLIDWRRGEQFFMRHLIDGDLASNNGGWQWSASTGTDAAPYFRVFNPFSQSRRFDPDGTFVRQWVPELRDMPAAALHSAAGLASRRLFAPGYPSPITDHDLARRRAIDAFRRRRRRPGA